MMPQIVAVPPVYVVATIFEIQVLEEDPIEGLPEFAVMNAVDNWIQGWICVAEPGEGSEEFARYAAGAEGFDYV